MLNADNDNKPTMTTTIHHYTAPEYVDEIINSGFIELEFHKYIDELNAAANDNIREARMMCHDFKSTGRYTWFTTASSSPVTGPYSTVRFSFLAEDIGAEKWETAKRRQIFKMGGRAVDAIHRLEQVALKKGENPQNWWISRNRVPVTGNHFDTVYKRPSPAYSIEKCMNFSDIIESWRRRDALKRHSAVAR